MIILEKQLQPLVRVITPEINIYALKERIEDYLYENSLPTHYKGHLVSALNVNGQSQEHSSDLRKYLNHFSDYNKFDVKKGYFIKPEIEHYWLQQNQIIIDITIRQFINHVILFDNPLHKIGNYSYLICDNPNDPVYQLYIEEIL